MSLAAEVELGALFLNAKEAVHVRRILVEMGHPQPHMPIQTDNSTAEGVINSRVRPKRTKSMVFGLSGCWIENSRANLKFIGGPVRRIWRITLQSIICRRTIEMCKVNFSHV